MRYYITKGFDFDAAHRLPNHDGKCQNLHGHTWRGEVTVVSEMLIEDGPGTGMVMDFGVIKGWLAPIVDELDHTLINDKIENPTAEHIAAYIFKRLEKELPRGLHSVRIWETPSNYCEVRR